MDTLVLIERLNQWLDDGYRAIVGTRIAPRFEVMRCRNVPVAKLRCFVFVKTVMHAQHNFVQAIEIELQINRRVVSRIAANDN